MDYVGITSAKGPPLSSLRLLVPPLQLMSASIWRVLQKWDVTRFWDVCEFVFLVKETVPDLLLQKHWTQLHLGLRARFILELCQKGDPIDCELIQSYLEKLKPQQSTQMEEVKLSEEEEYVDHFLKLINDLLKDNQERHAFFQEVFLEDYGPDFDSDLKMLFWEFLCRLEQLLPVPELQQTVLWLGDENSIFEDCLQCISEPTHMKNLLQHHKGLGHLEQHVPPSCMGDRILSSLSSAPQIQKCKTESQLSLLQDSNPQPVTFVDDAAMEIITVTEYAEVELTTNTDIEVMIEDKTQICTMAEDVVVISENVCKDMGESKEEKLQNVPANLEILKPKVLEDKTTLGRHSCPDCEKKFRFTSSLVAHRVIHSGERPHKCTECGRCFSFRQSLERHRNRHKMGKNYECAICGENFNLMADYTEHKQTHMQDGVYRCDICSKKFNLELALVKHLKRHNESKEVVAMEENFEVTKPKSECNTLEMGVIDPQIMNEVISLVKVRTSGRKRKPTMKVQMIDSQKKTLNKREKEVEEEKATEIKPKPLNSMEHSYGSSMVSSIEGDNVAVSDEAYAINSCPKTDNSHSEEAQKVINQSNSTFKPDKETQTTKFNCSDCNKSFKYLSVLKSHQRIHTGEQPYPCTQCGRQFSFKQSLERHKLTHKSDRKYECSICGEFFKSILAQKEHSKTHMQNNDYICHQCGKTFAWKSALVRHLKTHNFEKVGFKCTHCELDFNCASSLSRHLQNHQEERVHKCNCGKTFAHKTALKSHQRTHQKDRPHVCNQCGKGFLYKGGLVSHLKIHSQEMPYMCSYCGKSFKRERNMKKHERCHTREDVFQCSQCDKSFVYKATLTRHELTHSGERPFLCSDCGKGFFSYAELLKHERFHTGHKPFECQHCGKKFTQSCYLTIHLRYHSGVKPYQCSDCDKSFLSANRLKRHQRTHTGEKPYVCAECGKGFRQSYHLKMHQRTHALKLDGD